ncbi:MAG: hypothetical protein JRJ35_05240 [Deltaproteobacteria bacterium]|nr:hypothetical protein [Deltaproteobacteria bacterium]MBW1922859.1 hypothetical protein [Deltaproteobacteria bacterium]MBW2007594.1 hypothetical protein [Deltaproteobacteria bacterium]
MSLTQLCRGLYRDLLVISEMYRQQQWMHDQRSRRIDDRIVSISHAHFRPAKRGMAGSDVEFCHKVSVSLVDGNRFVDRINWDDFKECQDLQGRWKSTRGV